jgi:anhydro-N-acetylmuramic acid kinase
VKSLGRLLGTQRRRMVGLMSGTSADGIDVAVVDVERLEAPYPGALSWELLYFVSVPYPEAVRAEILAVQQGCERLLPRLTRLHALLPELFSRAVERAVSESGVPGASVDAVASHGQTVCHLPVFPEALEGDDSPRGRVSGEGWVSRSTLQIGEPAVLAERTGYAVVSDFRARDVAAGGTGAPLVPLVDHLLFADPERSRLVLNVGGIANTTALQAGAGRDDVMAYDTGPGNMVIDALMDLTSDGKRHVDLGGALAGKGNPHRGIVDEILAAAFFRQPPPRAAGREQFGRPFAEALLERCRRDGLSEASALATATWLSARAVQDAYDRFVRPRFEIAEIIVSGGGAHNVTLLRYLSELMEPAKVVTSDYYGLDVDAKEAVAFALLGFLSLDGEPGSLPSVTGAAHPVVLGSLTPGRE